MAMHARPLTKLKLTRSHFLFTRSVIIPYTNAGYHKDYEGYRENDCNNGEDGDGSKFKLCVRQMQVHKHVSIRLLDALGCQVLIAVDKELGRHRFEGQ